MYHSLLSPSLTSLPSLSVPTLISVLEGPSDSRRKFTKKLPRFLKIRLKAARLWLHSSGLQVTVLPLPRVCHFYKKRNKAFFPQKKVPEPVSHLALSHPFGFTTEAHLCNSYAFCARRTSKPTVSLRSDGPLPSPGPRAFPQTHFQSDPHLVRRPPLLDLA